MATNNADAPSVSDTIDPTVNSDGTLGFVPGSRWVNRTKNVAWLCLDATIGAAVWLPLTFLPSVAQAAAGYCEPFPRTSASGNRTLNTGTVYFSCFTAGSSFTVGNIVTATGGTAAATVTTCQVGLYSVAGAVATLLSASVNDATMWTATQTGYKKALAAPQAIKAGSRYAIACLFVGTTAPSLLACATGSSASPQPDTTLPLLGGTASAATLTSPLTITTALSSFPWAAAVA